MPDPRVAIIIPFTAWNPLVECCVEGCLALAYPSFVIVLLPNVETIIPARYAKESQIRIVPTAISNIPHKRNQGFKAIQDADYYALIDSDAYPRADWLRQATQAFGSFRNTWCVTGPNISPVYLELKQQAVANALMSSLVNGPRSFMRRLAAGSRFVEAAYSCNLVIAREAIEATGGFDEALETGEDTDFCRRIGKLGKCIYYSNMVKVYHHNRPLYLPFIRQRMLAGHSAPYLFCREPGISSLIFFLPLVFFLFIVLGWVPGLFYRMIMWMWLAGMVYYLFAALAEAGRWSKRFREIPLTWIAIMIGGLAPALGMIAGFARARFNSETFTSNFSTFATGKAFLDDGKNGRRGQTPGDKG